MHPSAITMPVGKPKTTGELPGLRPRRRTLGYLLAAMLGPSAAIPVSARTRNATPPVAAFQARLLRIQDGDSFLVRQIGSGRKLRVRLSGIDAPERDQPGADASRRRLETLLRNQLLDIVPVKHDVYGRLVAQVFVGDQDLGLSMIMGGQAWYFRRYRNDLPAQWRKRYETQESLAREAGIGLWRESSPEPPWRYRSRARKPR